MKTVIPLIAVLLLPGCMMSDWPGVNQGPVGYGFPAYGYPAYGYRYPAYGYSYGYPGYGWNGYSYGYNSAGSEDWRRWQAYQYGLSQGQGSRVPQPSQSLPYGITRNPGGTYKVPGYGNVTPGQIQNWARKHRR